MAGNDRCHLRSVFKVKLDYACNVCKYRNILDQFYFLIHGNRLYSLLGAMFPLPRIIYAMASDGLIFEWMGKVSSRFHTPLMGTFSAGILTGSLCCFFFFFFLLLYHSNNIHCCLKFKILGLLAAIFELTQLVNMMSIGTLLAYSIVATCVLILR